MVPKPMRIQREGAQLQIRGTWSAGSGDDQARFLSDLRSLRDSVAIGYDELSARAHYPSDVLKEAENGPALSSTRVPFGNRRYTRETFFAILASIALSQASLCPDRISIRVVPGVTAGWPGRW